MTAENDSIDLVDRLVAEYADRLARDEDPRREELLAQAPAFRAELERCFRMLDGADDEPGPGALVPGRSLAGYRLEGVLGRGGMAVVYAAEEPALGRRVALKVLRPHLALEERALERFQREARAAAKLRHPSIVPVHAVGRAEGHVFIAFELVPGPNLARVIGALAASGSRPGPADLARVTGRADLADARSYAEACVRLLEGPFAAIEHAHAEGVLHRDLKPSNLLLDTTGRVLVSDFGLAKDLGEVSLSITGETIGTPHYMSPEQANALAGAVDARTDVYSLGVTLYELLTLQRPFEGRTLQEIVSSIATRTPPSPSVLAADVPERLGDVVLAALAKAPTERYASVAAFRADLARALAGEEVTAAASRGLTALLGGWFQARMRGQPFEYRSRRTLLGLPWIHVVDGVRDPRTHQPRWARGVIAVGNYAVGGYAAGGVAVGFLALGGIALGPIALGALVVGMHATGALAFGWNAEGLMVAGHHGRGLTGSWLAHPEAIAPTHVGLAGDFPSALLVTVVLGLMAPTLFHAMWSRTWPAPEHRAFLRRVTTLWMPLAYLAAFLLSDPTLPFMGHLVVALAITAAFAAFVTVRLRAPRA